MYRFDYHALLNFLSMIERRGKDTVIRSISISRGEIGIDRPARYRTVMFTWSKDEGWLDYWFDGTWRSPVTIEKNDVARCLERWGVKEIF